MIRQDLENIPTFAWPAGFGLRAYHPGDRDTWVRIVAAADLHQGITAADHLRAFGHDESELTRRQLYVVAPDGQAIGTASAWFGSEETGRDWGRIHWVAILPDWQGQGLGRALLSATLLRLRGLGHTRAYLTTETVRHRGIRLYLGFGFIPDVAGETARAGQPSKIFRP